MFLYKQHHPLVLELAVLFFDMYSNKLYVRGVKRLNQGKADI